MNAYMISDFDMVTSDDTLVLLAGKGKNHYNIKAADLAGYITGKIGFDEVDTRLANIDSRLAVVQSGISSLKADIATLKSSIPSDAVRM